MSASIEWEENSHENTQEHITISPTNQTQKHPSIEWDQSDGNSPTVPSALDNSIAWESRISKVLNKETLHDDGSNFSAWIKTVPLSNLKAKKESSSSNTNSSITEVPDLSQISKKKASVAFKLDQPEKDKSELVDEMVTKNPKPLVNISSKSKDSVKKEDKARKNSSKNEKSKPVISRPVITSSVTTKTPSNADEELFLKKLDQANSQLKQMKLGKLSSTEYELPSTSENVSNKDLNVICNDNLDVNSESVSKNVIHDDFSANKTKLPLNALVLKHEHETRTWTDASGTFQVIASFISLTSVEPFLVYLLRTDNVKVSVPLSKLSRDDVVWIREKTRVKNSEPSLTSPKSSISAVQGESMIKQKHRPPPPPPASVSTPIIISSQDPNLHSLKNNSKQKILDKEGNSNADNNSAPVDKISSLLESHRSPPFPPKSILKQTPLRTNNVEKLDKIYDKKDFEDKLSSSNTFEGKQSKDDEIKSKQSHKIRADDIQSREKEKESTIFSKEETDNKYAILNESMNKNEIDLSKIKMDKLLLKQAQFQGDSISKQIECKSMDELRHSNTNITSKNISTQDIDSSIPTEKVTISKLKEKIEKARSTHHSLVKSPSFSEPFESSHSNTTSTISSPISNSAIDAVYMDLKQQTNQSSNYQTLSSKPKTSSTYNHITPNKETESIESNREHCNSHMINPSLSTDNMSKYSVLTPEQRRFSQSNVRNTTQQITPTSQHQSHPQLQVHYGQPGFSTTYSSGANMPPINQSHSFYSNQQHINGHNLPPNLPIPMVRTSNNMPMNSIPFHHGSRSGNMPPFQNYSQPSSYYVETITYSEPNNRNGTNYLLPSSAVPPMNPFMQHQYESQHLIRGPSSQQPPSHTYYHQPSNQYYSQYPYNPQ